MSRNTRSHFGSTRDGLNLTRTLVDGNDSGNLSAHAQLRVGAALDTITGRGPSSPNLRIHTQLVGTADLLLGSTRATRGLARRTVVHVRNVRRFVDTSTTLLITGRLRVLNRTSTNTSVLGGYTRVCNSSPSIVRNVTGLASSPAVLGTNGTTTSLGHRNIHICGTNGLIRTQSIFHGTLTLRPGGVDVTLGVTRSLLRNASADIPSTRLRTYHTYLGAINVVPSASPHFPHCRGLQDGTFNR